MRPLQLLSWVGRRGGLPTNVEELAAEGRARLPRMIADFVDGGAESERSVRANRTAFDHWALVPRALTGVAHRDLGTTVLGSPLSMPIALAPVGLARLVHPDGERAAARAAARASTAFTLSTGSSCSLESVAEQGDGPRWFQLYLWRDREVIADLMDRAGRSGYGALVLTVDVPLIGRRERDVRNGMSIPPRVTPRNAADTLRHPGWLRGLVGGEPITFANFTDVPGRGRDVVDLAHFVNVEMMNPGADWGTFDWVREHWRGPLAIKGILHPDDAREAVDRGASAVIVSNHGGRQLDAAIGSLDALPEIVRAVGERAEVLLDGGIRRGTDVLKALALGARAVLVGRPYVLGLAARGQAGAELALTLLRDELDRSMAMCGLRSLDEVTPDLVRRVAGSTTER